MADKGDDGNFNNVSGFVNSFLENSVVTQDFNNFLDGENIKINKHTSDLWNQRFGGLSTDLVVHQGTQNILLFSLTHTFELGKVGLQPLEILNLAGSLRLDLSWDLSLDLWLGLRLSL